MHSPCFSVLIGSLGPSLGVYGNVDQLTGLCSDALPHVLCINRYTAVMPNHFYRQASNGSYEDTYASTSVFNDTSFAAIADAEFLVFDKERGLDILGPNPTNEYMFTVPGAHEAPVYYPATEKLLMSRLGDPLDYLPQVMVDLRKSPPTVSEFISDPPIYSPNGGTIHDGLIYWVTAGGLVANGTEFRPGIYTLNLTTGKTEPILNNYYGYYFSSPNDIAVDSKGDIWFTDSYYGWFNGASDTTPQIPPASWRFRPSTGAVNIIEDSLEQPNGIAISPDGKTVYIGDTGAASGTYVQSLGPGGVTLNATGKRTIYAYDVDGVDKQIVNKRPFYLTQNLFPDGLKVARNGYVVTAAGRGVDVLDMNGMLLLRIQANYTVLNFAWTGKVFETLWMVGIEGISKVEWNLPGPVLR